MTGVDESLKNTKGADQTGLEGAGPQTVSVWATAMSAGPADDCGQALSFPVPTTNAALFSAQPAVSATGTLTFTPAAGATGAATVTVQLHDNGGVANGGVDTSAAQTMAVKGNAVDHGRRLINGKDQTVLEDAGLQTVSGWATAISAGPADESGQTLNFIVTTTNAALFSAQPAVSATGTLTFTPAAGATGAATVTVQLHDNGGAANGGVDTSAPQTLTITVTAVNRAPAANAQAATPLEGTAKAAKPTATEGDGDPP